MAWIDTLISAGTTGALISINTWVGFQTTPSQAGHLN